jgi:hypothetical protein
LAQRVEHGIRQAVVICGGPFQAEAPLAPGSFVRQPPGTHLAQGGAEQRSALLCRARPDAAALGAGEDEVARAQQPSTYGAFTAAAHCADAATLILSLSHGWCAWCS